MKHSSEPAIREVLCESIEVKQQTMDWQVASAGRVAEALIDCFRAGGKLLLFGNGGSAADAQHVAAEFVGRFYSDHAPLPAIALTTDTSVLTAVGNDFAFDQLFARQVQALARPGDVVVGFSTSGNSANVVDGLTTAKKLGAITVGFTGRTGGKIGEVVDLLLAVPSDVTPRVQEVHITLWHAICQVVVDALCGAAAPNVQ